MTISKESEYNEKRERTGFHQGIGVGYEMKIPKPFFSFNVFALG